MLVGRVWRFAVSVKDSLHLQPGALGGKQSKVELQIGRSLIFSQRQSEWGQFVVMFLKLFPFSSFWMYNKFSKTSSGNLLGWQGTPWGELRRQWCCDFGREGSFRSLFWTDWTLVDILRSCQAGVKYCGNTKSAVHRTPLDWPHCVPVIKIPPGLVNL